MSSLPGLPPLPRSLSGFGLDNGGLEPGRSPPPLPPARVPSRGSGGGVGNRLVKTPSSTSSQSSRPSPQGSRQLTTLDTQLSILRREMFGLRQLDLSLLSQLWSLNESIQEFRQLLQDQEDRAPSPSPSSDDGEDSISLTFSHQLASAIHQQQQQQQMQQQPPPPPRRPAPAAPVHQQHQYHHQQQQQPQQQHHYRSARSRNSISSLGQNLANSDDSPSSEEYGAV
ncbi:hypothetical protein TKK_0008233 [Trichogramma kaykai]